MELGEAGLREEDLWMMGVNLGDLENTSGEKEEYWLLAIKSMQGGCGACRATGSIGSDNCKGQALISYSEKSLCSQGWKAFSSQSYQGH